MTRRELIALLGGTAATWPFGAWAQHGERMRRVGVLSNLGADDAEAQARTAAFEQALQELGWIIGGNLQIDYRWSGGDADRLRTHAAELVALAPDVVFATSGVSILPLQQASREVPLVFAQTIDPVGLGVVESLSRPGAMRRGSPRSNLALPQNGWSFSSKLHLPRRTRPFFATLSILLE
jgi:putative ABC transport system substrate-binding protein